MRLVPRAEWEFAMRTVRHKRIELKLRWLIGRKPEAAGETGRHRECTLGLV